jgi:hypothetical protein
MSKDILIYCMKSIVQYLNGDIEKFERYRDLAMRAYEKERCITTIGELISATTKKKMYEMVS